MSRLRRHLGLWTILWLSCQAASLSAFVVSAAGRDLAESVKSCFQAPTSDACPMHGPDGGPCPMHRDGGSEKGADEQSCAMRALDGPDAALAGLFSIPGILIGETHAPVDDSASALTSAFVRRPSTPSGLDSPPPRS